MSETPSFASERETALVGRYLNVRNVTGVSYQLNRLPLPGKPCDLPGAGESVS